MFLPILLIKTYRTDMSSYFGQFQGFSECNIRAADLYSPPDNNNPHFGERTFCGTRKDLLEAMSGGGRVGFDTPYTPRGKSLWLNLLP